MLLTVVPGWSEGVLLHTPARRENDKVSDGHSWLCTWAGQHCEDGGILKRESIIVRVICHKLLGAGTGILLILEMVIQNLPAFTASVCVCVEGCSPHGQRRQR